MTRPQTVGVQLLTTVRRMASEEAAHVSLQAVEAEASVLARPAARALGESLLTAAEKAELGALLPKTGGGALPANLRFPNYRAAFALVLDRLNLRVSLRTGVGRRWLRALADRAHDWLGDRRIIDLAAPELTTLRTEVHAYLVEASKGFLSARTSARKAARQITGAVGSPVVHSRVELPAGVWYFFHTDASNPVVVSELFVPRVLASGTAVPARPAFPSGTGVAGLGGRGGVRSGTGAPRWLLDTGGLGSTPPALTAAPVNVVSGLPVAVLADGPSLLVDQLARAELRQLARTWVPLTNKEVRFVGVPAELRRTLGLGIDSIEYLPVPPGGGTLFDLRVRIKGRLGREAVRIGDEDVLPLPSALGLVDHARLHLWGAIFGDSTPAGIAYGLTRFNQLQLTSIETYLKAGRRGNTAAVELEATAFIKLRKINGDTYPFLHEVRYEYTVDKQRFRYRIYLNRGEPTLEAPVLIR